MTEELNPKGIMARITLLTQFFPPETGAGARRLEALARALSERHEVTVVTLFPSYPSPTHFMEVDLEQFDTRYGFVIRRTFSFQPYSKNLFFRGIREILMSFRLLFNALSYPVEVVIVSTPSMFLGPFTYFLSWIKRSKVIWDVRDLTWRYGRQSVTANRVQSGLMVLLESSMRFFLKRTDLVVGATPGVSQILISEHDVPEERNITVLNGISRKFFHEFDLPRIEEHERPRVTYIGLLGNNHGISILVDVAREMPEIDFIIVGDGPEEPLIREKLDRLDLKNLQLMGYCTDHKELIRYYQETDILFNHTKDRPVLNRTVVPAKFSEYMSSGKPFVYAGKGIGVQFLDEISCARIASPDDISSIIDAIKWVLNHEDEAKFMAQRGREYVEENMIREDLMERYVTEIENHLLNSLPNGNMKNHSDEPA